MSDTLETTPHGATDAEHDAHGPAGHHGYIGDRQRYLNRLKRIEGQARAALESVALGLLEDHLRHCVVDAARQGDEQAKEKIREASAAIARFVR